MPEQYIITGTITSPEGVDHTGSKFEVFDRQLPSLERHLGSVPQI